MKTCARKLHIDIKSNGLIFYVYLGGKENSCSHCQTTFVNEASERWNKGKR